MVQVTILNSKLLETAIAVHWYSLLINKMWPYDSFAEGNYSY